ncbi:hypothetical protein GOBAR_AA24821 [Gossypium barbadense]|uniref:Uncharacterized protein n=1 Tax=Gossypium barbadense TaxID=3634 RepID=A0A2P5WXN5_GOSBA|nr:hypothetical protein GOBAR_AA24821 [Gossypium barbadense]
MESVSFNFTSGRCFNPVAFATQKQHVLLVLKTHHLKQYIDGSVLVPSRTVNDAISHLVENPTFAQYEK